MSGETQDGLRSQGGIFVATAVLVLCVAGAFMTQGVMEHLPFLNAQRSGWSGVPIRHGILDQRPWQTTQTLAALGRQVPSLVRPRSDVKSMEKEKGAQQIARLRSR